MANEQNLRPSEYKLSQEEAKKGGINSGIARRKKKEFRELFEKMLSEDGGVLNGEKVSRKDMVTAKAIQVLLSEKTTDRDFLKAFEIVRDTIGEKPVDQVEQLNTDIVINLGEKNDND